MSWALPAHPEKQWGQQQKVEQIAQLHHAEQVNISTYYFCLALPLSC